MKPMEIRLGTSPLNLDNQRLLRMRNFSKPRFAGMRVDTPWKCGMILEFNKIRNHFGVGLVAQAAARAAEDQAHRSVEAQVKHSLETLKEIAVENGLLLPTASNFLIDCGKDGAFARL